MKRAALAAMLAFASLTASADIKPPAPANFGIVRFVSPAGIVGNTGLTADSPWPLNYAMAQAVPATLIFLLPGTYPSIEISRPGIKLVSQTKWGARVVGSAQSHGVWTDNNVGNVTIDGIEISSSALDGIKLNGTNCVVRNCWVHDSLGNGVSAMKETGTLLERNLVEHNGDGSAGGQGLALSGTNCIIRGNVLRYNQSWACEIYDLPPYSSAECYFYDNLLYLNGSGLTVWSPAGQTNYVVNNTIVTTTNNCVISQYGNLRVTNNIFLAGAGYAAVANANGSTVWSDYNLVDSSSSILGPHDVVSSNPGFENPSTGQYWLTSAASARAIANPAVVPPVDFFGKMESVVADVGAFQFDSTLATDTRTLDPSGSSGADYWAKIGGSVLAATIDTQPQNKTVIDGQIATFSVVASGDAPLTYQWTFNGLNVGSGSSYVRQECQLSDSGGLVKVTVSNGGGVVQSSAATLIVNPMGKMYYVAPNGATGNTGFSTNSPWPLTYALIQIGPSNTITLLPGTYPSIPISQSGTILRSQVKWGAKIVGSAGAHGIWTTGDHSVSNVVVEGFEVSHTYVDGVKLNGPYSTVRNCWIHHSGMGDPNAVVNTDFSYTGQGVAAHNERGTVVEYNLIENNGMTIGQDHGIYISGTNTVVRGNVIRYNLAYGVQVFDSVGDCQNNQVYNNLIYGNKAGITVWSRGGFTNYVYNNTVISTTNYCVVSDYGHLIAANNILVITTGWFPTIATADSSVVETDYNLVSKAAKAPCPGGAHDVVATNPGFVNMAAGLFWLASNSPARGIAKPGFTLPVDFFGQTGAVLTDAGAFQYDAALAGDSRTLDPSSPNAAYWAVH